MPLAASHQQHGLAWTNGKDVFMSPISVDENQLENSTSTLLGTFEYALVLIFLITFSDNSWNQVSNALACRQQTLGVLSVLKVIWQQQLVTDFLYDQH
jgi:hypothetical protein